MTFPKWVDRGYGIGQALCVNEEEEAAILADKAAREEPVEPAEVTATTDDAAGAPVKNKGGRPRKVQ